MGALRAEMVVHDIEQHHQPVAVGRLDQGLQVLWSAIGTVWRVGQRAVVAPVPWTGKSPIGVTSIAVTTERNQVVELADCSIEGTF
jgi:hypothetical protein